MDSIYKIPRSYHEQGVDDIVVERLGLSASDIDLSEWDAVVEGLGNPVREITVAMVGKYVDLSDSYKSLNEALIHAGIKTRTFVKIVYLDSEDIERDGTDCLRQADAILVPGGFGKRGIEGKIQAARFARLQGVPYLGLCLGMQVAVIEFARSVAGMAGANSTEFDRDCAFPVIALITEWVTQDGVVERRGDDADLGGTMRLGSQPSRLRKDSRCRAVYGRDVIMERHRHRYEFNNTYMDELQDAGLMIAGKTIDGNLVEVVEMADHPGSLAASSILSSPLTRVMVIHCSSLSSRPPLSVGKRPPPCKSCSSRAPTQIHQANPAWNCAHFRSALTSRFF